MVVKVFRISDPPAHSLTEQNSTLFLIPQGFRISDPPSRQGTKMDICPWSSQYSEFLIPHHGKGQKSICSCLSKYSEFLIPQAT